MLIRGTISRQKGSLSSIRSAETRTSFHEDLLDWSAFIVGVVGYGSWALSYRIPEKGGSSYLCLSFGWSRRLLYYACHSNVINFRPCGLGLTCRGILQMSHAYLRHSGKDDHYKGKAFHKRCELFGRYEIFFSQFLLLCNSCRDSYSFGECGWQIR